MTQEVEEVQGPPEKVDETEIALMQAEYRLLVPRLLTACNGVNPKVVIAALMSAAGSVAVQTSPNETDAKTFIIMCMNDVLDRLPDAFKQKEMDDGGNHAGEQGEGGNQEVA